MKRIALTVAIVLLGLMLIPMSSKASKIAFVNLKKVLQESNMGKLAKQQIKSLIEAKKIVIRKKEQKVKEIIKKLNNKKLSKREKEKLQKEYSKAMADLQQYQAQASEEIRQKEIEETNKILSKAVSLIKNYAKKHGIDGVFETSQGGVVYWNDKMDITNEIIKEINSKPKNKK